MASADTTFFDKMRQHWKDVKEKQQRRELALEKLEVDIAGKPYVVGVSTALNLLRDNVVEPRDVPRMAAILHNCFGSWALHSLEPAWAEAQKLIAYDASLSPWHELCLILHEALETRQASSP